jgi:hypothetical protein
MSLIGEGAKDAKMWGYRSEKLLKDAKRLLCVRARLRSIREEIGILVRVVVQAYIRFHDGRCSS